MKWTVHLNGRGYVVSGPPEGKVETSVNAWDAQSFANWDAANAYAQRYRAKVHPHGQFNMVIVAAV